MSAPLPDRRGGFAKTAKVPGWTGLAKGADTCFERHFKVAGAQAASSVARVEEVAVQHTASALVEHIARTPAATQANQLTSCAAMKRRDPSGEGSLVGEC